jgi:hypothetical protein
MLKAELRSDFDEVTKKIDVDRQFMQTMDRKIAEIGMHSGVKTALNDEFSDLRKDLRVFGETLKRHEDVVAGLELSRDRGTRERENLQRQILGTKDLINNAVLDMQRRLGGLSAAISKKVSKEDIADIDAKFVHLEREVARAMDNVHDPTGMGIQGKLVKFEEKIILFERHMIVMQEQVDNTEQILEHSSGKLGGHLLDDQRRKLAESHRHSLVGQLAVAPSVDTQKLQEDMADLAKKICADAVNSLKADVEHILHAVRVVEAKQSSMQHHVDLIAKDASGIDAYRNRGDDAGVLSLETVERSIEGASEQIRSDFRAAVDAIHQRLSNMAAAVEARVSTKALRDVHVKLGKRIEHLELIATFKPADDQRSTASTLPAVARAPPQRSPSPPRRPTPFESVSMNLTPLKDESVREAMRAIGWQARLAQFGSPRDSQLRHTAR